MKSLIAFVMACIIALAACPAAAQQAWPSKPIRLMLGVGPGAAPDVLGRILAERLGPLWGQNLVAENRAGAAGNLAAVQVAKSAPDGYTLWFAQGGPLSVNQYLYKSLGFDPDRDFAPVAFAGASPMLMAVNAGVGVSSVQELLALAKAQPGKLVLGTSSVNGAPHLIAEWFFQTAGVKLLTVNYKSAPQSVQAAMVNEVQVLVDGAASLLAHRRSDKLKLLAFSTPKRLPGLEDIATMGEAVPGFSIIGYFAVMFPAGVPQELVRRANRDVNATLASQVVASRYAQLGIFPHEGFSNGPPEALSEFLRQDRMVWRRVTQDLKIQPE
jgi:tripartite-type tricarboxylate transporter receptor subunit TctC